MDTLYDDKQRVIVNILTELTIIAQNNEPFGLPRAEVKIKDEALKNIELREDLENLFSRVHAGKIIKCDFKDDNLTLTINTHVRNDTACTPQPEEFTFFLTQLTRGKAIPVLLDIFYFKEYKIEESRRIVAYINGCSRVPQQTEQNTLLEHRLKISLPLLTLRNIPLVPILDMIYNSNYFHADISSNGDALFDINSGAGILIIRMDHKLYKENKEMIIVSNHKREYTQLLYEEYSISRELITIILDYLTIS